MNKKLREKIRESLTSVVPISAIVFLLSIYAVPIPIGATLMFILGAAMLVVGMGFFSLGAEIAMMPMGEGLGAHFGASRRIVPLAVFALIMGTIITVAEPDLQVLARQVPAIPDEVLIATVAGGVGLSLVVALLRARLGVSLPKMLVVAYALTIAISLVVPKAFIAVAFDSGGVTTGPMTVPFIIALGVGLASRASMSSDDSFGIVAICSIGPIIAVMILGIVYDPSVAMPEEMPIYEAATTKDVAAHYAREIPHYVAQVARAIAPVALFFGAFQIATRRYTARSISTIVVGLVYTFVGLVLFLTGANVGFIPVGLLLGAEIAASGYRWLLVPVGALIGYYVVVAEPAVHVLNKQVESISGGAVSRRVMMLALSIGVALSLALSMVRILTGISLYWTMIPGLVIALALMRATPKIFTGIAFDSGGVASGPMTSTFVLPFAMGACESVGGDIMTEAFGVVAMVSMTPLVMIQLLGLVYARQTRRAVFSFDAPDSVIDFDDEAIIHV